MLSRLVSLSLLAFLLSTGLPSVLQAQGAPMSVQVTVRSVLGSNDGGSMPSELDEDVKASLRSMPYKNFEVLETQRSSLGANAQNTFQVTGGRTLTIAVKEIESGKVRVHIRLVQGSKSLWDSTMGIPKNKSVIISGQAHGRGMLFLPITVTFPR